MDAETRLQELRAVIREEATQELLRQLNESEKQLLNARVSIRRLNLENDSLRLNIKFLENTISGNLNE
jgi:hypothetical protein